MRRVALCVVVLWLTVASIPLTFPQQNATSSDVAVDAGSIEANKYTSDFFRFSYEFPKGWTPHGEATKQRISELGKEKIGSSSAASKSGVAVAEKHTQNLLTVFEHPLGTPGIAYNRAVIVVAEDISFAPGIQSGKDYLAHMVPMLKRAGYEELAGPTEVKVDGYVFFRSDLKGKVHETQDIYQSILCSRVKDHALAFIFTTEDKNATDALAKTFETVHFVESAPSTVGKPGR